MTTRTDTKKFELLQSSPQVAILVHDFPQVQDAESAAAAAATSDGASPLPAAPLDVTREGSAGGEGGWVDVDSYEYCLTWS